MADRSLGKPPGQGHCVNPSKGPWTARCEGRVPKLHTRSHAARVGHQLAALLFLASKSQRDWMAVHEGSSQVRGAHGAYKQAIRIDAGKPAMKISDEGWALAAGTLHALPDWRMPAPTTRAPSSITPRFQSHFGVTGS